jgi:hypothetical protein
MWVKILIIVDPEVGGRHVKINLKLNSTDLPNNLKLFLTLL